MRTTHSNASGALRPDARWHQRFSLVLSIVPIIALWPYPSSINADPLDVWHSRTSGVANVLNAVAYGNGTWVVVGSGGVIAYSADGISWRHLFAGTTASLNSVIFANDQFVAVGDSGWIFSSTNGTRWTHRLSGTTDSLYDVNYGGEFVAMSDTGTITTSQDGLSWTAKSVGTSNVYGVAFGNGQYVAIGGKLVDPAFMSYATVVYSSTNGQDWSPLDPGQPYLISDIWFANGTFVAAGLGGGILTSSDGSTWTQQNSGTTDSLWNVCFGNDTFVIVDGTQGGIFTSPDTVTWTARNSGNVNSLYNVAYGAGTFIAVGFNGTILQSDSVLPPSLQLSKSGTNLVFSWPTAAGNFAIEETETLAAPSWSQTPNQIPTMVGDQTVVSLTGPEQSMTKFYRLAKKP